MNKKLSRSVLLAFVFILLLHPTSFTQQHPGDPGLPDTVFFGDIDYYIDSSSLSGKLKIPIIFANDELMNGICVPLLWSGAATLDSASFVGNRFEGLPVIQGDTIDNENHKLTVYTVVWDNLMLAEGRGLFASLFFNVTDTGWIEIDTTFFGNCNLTFARPVGGFTPQFVKGLFHLIPSVAADANQDGGVGITDVVFLISYLFKGGTPPTCSNCADVTSDCEINIIDVVYLISYLFRQGESPQMGCVLNF